MYWLPFFSEIYYVPMQKTFGFTNTQIGNLVSFFGIISLISYFPGGWLADRFSPRKLISLALAISAAAGYIFSTIPSFKVCLILYGTWGFAAALIFWSALIKATRNWAPKEEQGRAFGILEGGRNLVDMTAAAIILWYFAVRGGDDAALSENIIVQSSCALAMAILVWGTMKDDKPSRDNISDEGSKIDIKRVKEVLKLPIVWLMSIIILTAYSGMWGAIYFTPYATDVYALGDIFGGAVGVGKIWLAAISAVVAGFIADKIGTAKSVVGCFIIMTTGFLIFAIVPGGPNLVPFMLVNAAVISLIAYALRGIYFSLLEQGGIPVAVTGTATGVISVIGYTPDIFIPPLAGVILDANPGASGYQILFLINGILSFIGLIAACIAYCKIQRGRG